MVTGERPAQDEEKRRIYEDVRQMCERQERKSLRNLKLLAQLDRK